MIVNASKTKTTIVARSRTMYLQSAPLYLGDTVQKEPADINILHVTFHAKMTFDKHLRSVSKAASQ